MKHGMLATLVLAFGAVAALGDDDTERKGKAMLQVQGAWVAVSAERNGEPADDIKGHKLIFLKDRFGIEDKNGKGLFGGVFTVDPALKPTGIDFIHGGGVLKDKVWKGIYEVDSDTLKVCDNGPDLDKARPKDFKAKAGSGYVSIVFKRDKR